MQKIPQDETFSLLDLPRAIWFFLAEERYKFLIFVGVLILVLFYTMVPPYLVGMMANFLIEYVRTTGTKPSIEPMFWLVSALVVGHAVIAMIRLSSKRVLGHLSLNARYRAKVWGFERLLDFSLTWHHQESTGNKAQRILTGSEAIREWTGDLTNNIFPALTAFVGSLIACMFLHPAFALFFLYYIGVLLGTEFYFDHRISALTDRINKSLENASGTFVESAANILAVKAMGAAGGMASNVQKREELARRLSYDSLKLSNTKWMCFQLHNAVSWGAYLVAVAYMVMDGALGAGFFLTYAMYFDKLREASVDFTDKIQTMIVRKSNLGRMMPIFWGDHRLAGGHAKFPADWKSISIDQAVFRYGDKPAVGPLSLMVDRGEIVGIAGHSGSGKSTLVKLLLGLYHLESGQLKIGDVPISQIKHEELTAQVSVVLQETELFNFSLKENITMMREVAPDVLERACAVACLNELIARLPEGLNTEIGERGYALSGGERQRVGIARAVCRNAQILMLDEATSALDSATEQKVMNALFANRTANQTMLIVAHRISTLRQADRIVVFEAGQIVEEGNFDSLSRDAATRFGSMYAIQQA